MLSALAAAAQRQLRQQSFSLIRQLKPTTAFQMAAR